MKIVWNYSKKLTILRNKSAVKDDRTFLFSKNNPNIILIQKNKKPDITSGFLLSKTLIIIQQQRLHLMLQILRREVGNERRGHQEYGLDRLVNELRFSQFQHQLQLLLLLHHE